MAVDGSALGEMAADLSFHFLSSCSDRERDSPAQGLQLNPGGGGGVVAKMVPWKGMLGSFGVEQHCCITYSREGPRFESTLRDWKKISSFLFLHFFFSFPYPGAIFPDTHQELDWLQCFSGNVPQRKRKEKEKAKGQRLAINSKVKG